MMKCMRIRCPFCFGFSVLGEISRRTTLIIKHPYCSLPSIANKSGGLGNIWAINVSGRVSEYQPSNEGSDEDF